MVGEINLGTYSNQRGYHFKGYFEAIKGGVYKFQGTSDDGFALFMAAVPGSA